MTHASPLSAPVLSCFSPRRAFSWPLLAGVSALALLAGCSAFDIRNPFGSQRPEQHVEGERRVPLYNRGVLPPTPGQPASSMMVPTPPPPAPSSMAQAPAPDTLGTLNPAPVRLESAPSSTHLARKPVASNPAYIQSPIQPAAPTAAEPQPAPKVQPSFFERLFGPSPPPATPDDTVMRSPVSEVERTEPAPPLSSVPPVPGEFKDVTASHQSTMDDLSRERDTAQARRQALEEEPSQQQPVTPIEMPTPPATASAMPEPLLTSKPAAIEPPSLRKGTEEPASIAPAMPEPASPVLVPRRGIDIMTQEEWDALHKMRPLDKPAPQEMTPVPAVPDSVLPSEESQRDEDKRGELTPAPMESAGNDARKQDETAPPARAAFVDRLLSAPSGPEPQSDVAAIPPASSPVTEETAMLKEPAAEMGNKREADAKETDIKGVTETTPARASLFDRMFGSPASPSSIKDAASQMSDEAQETPPAWAQRWLTPSSDATGPDVPAPAQAATPPPELPVGTQLLGHASDPESMPLASQARPEDATTAEPAAVTMVKTVALPSAPASPPPAALPSGGSPVNRPAFYTRLYEDVASEETAEPQPADRPAAKRSFWDRLLGVSDAKAEPANPQETGGTP